MTYHCVRCGFCCSVATCGTGTLHGAPPKGCTFLKGARPGEYSCQLATTLPDLFSWTIGKGCSSTLCNSSRESVFRRLAEGDLPELLEILETEIDDPNSGKRRSRPSVPFSAASS